MTRKILISTGFLWFLVLSVYSQELPGLKVIGRYLYDKCGEKVILRGVSNPNIWFHKDGLPQYGEIEQTGANVIRIVWDTSGSSIDLDNAIGNCIALNMIPMIELHDATGDWSKLQQCVNYWCRNDVVSVIQTYEEFLLINIANEVGDASITNAAFKNDYSKHVSTMRAAGIHVPLVIDGTDWGKNIDILQSQGPSLITADPDHNLMFSVHMWWPKMYYSNNVQKIKDEIAQSVKMGLPLIVGEFSQQFNNGDCNMRTINAQNAIPYDTIISECQKNEVGYIAWSWFGNCNPLWDMTTDGTFANLTDWGLDVAVNNENSIQNTSVRPYSIQFGKCNPASSIDNYLVGRGKNFELKNFPNPFSDKTFIRYRLNEDAGVEISIFNSMGGKVSSIIQLNQPKGNYSIPFDAAGLQSGIYFCSILSGNRQETKKMLIIK